MWVDGPPAKQEERAPKETIRNLRAGLVREDQGKRLKPRNPVKNKGLKKSAPQPWRHNVRTNF